MAVVVSDTSPVLALAHLGLLDLLQALYTEILLPPAVEQELLHPPPGLPAVDPAQVPYFRVQAPQDQNQVGQFLRILDPGESEALALALEVHAGAVLMDEAAGRAVALQAGLRPIGALGVLLEAKSHGLIAAVRPLMDRLENEIQFYISARLRAEVLRSAGE